MATGNAWCCDRVDQHMGQAWGLQGRHQGQVATCAMYVQATCRTAFLWEGNETWQESQLTYSQLLEMVGRVLAAQPAH
jgi:hypothetical protein